MFSISAFRDACLIKPIKLRTQYIDMVQGVVQNDELHGSEADPAMYKHTQYVCTFQVMSEQGYR